MAGLRNQRGRREIAPNSALSAPHPRLSCGVAFLCGTRLSLLASAPPPAAFALAARTADHVLKIIVPVIVGDFLIGLYAAQCPNEDAAAIGVGLCIGIA